MAQSQTLSKQLQSKQSEPFQAFVGLEDRQSNLAPALLAVAGLKGSDIKGEILTKPFLDICRPIVNVLDHLGSTMAVIRADVSGNIQRLDELNQTGKAEYRVLFEIVREEAAANTAKRPLSCSKAILWLTRSLDFTLSLFRKLLDHPDWTLKTAVEESYCETLKPWHGWISVAASNVGLKLIPERQTFLDIVAGDASATLEEDLERFISALSPILEEIHSFMVKIPVPSKDQIFKSVLNVF